jgi:MFS family permease
MPERANPEIAGVVVGVVLLVLGLGLVFGPSLAGADMMRYGYGLGMVGVIVAVIGLVTALMFRSRAVAWARFMAGEDLLVHWRYEPDDWRRYVEAEYTRDRGARLRLLGVTAALMVVVGGAFVLVDPEGGLWVAIVLAGVLALLAALAVGLPWWRYRRDRESPGEVRIAPNGVWMNGRLNLWDRQGGRLDGATWVEGEPPQLGLRVSYLSRTGRAEEPVFVPVPRGQEEAGRQVLEQLEQRRPSRKSR